MKPPRLLFQSRNRRGLGHLMRGLNLARAIRRQDPAIDIVFYARHHSADALCGPEFRAIVERDSDGMGHWPEVVHAVAPDLVVYDTMLPADPAEVQAAPAARRVFVMRKVRDDKQADALSHPFLEQVDLVLVPHTRDEFGHSLSPALDAKTAFVGPIVRLPDATRQERVRSTYHLAPGDFVLTSTVGGGGFADQAEAFFATVYAIHRAVEQRLPRLRHIVVQGPNFGGALAPLPGMTVVEYEPDLIDLLAISDLVVAEGGYNTVNEIRVARTPAVFLPSIRNLDDQEERVRALERAGLAAVCVGLEPDAIAARVAEVCTAPAWLAGVRRRYTADRVDTGNQAAAERILELVGR
jgi:predicted glycosyltransferase